MILYIYKQEEFRNEFIPGDDEPEVFEWYVDGPELIGTVDSFISLQWTEEYRGKGYFELVCAETDDNASHLKQGYYICKQGGDTAMVIRRIESDSETQQMIISGYTTLDLLAQRIIIYTESTHDVVNSMYKLVENHIGSGVHKSMDYRMIRSIVTAPAAGYDTNAGTYIHDSQVSWKNLLEALVSLADTCDIGFRMKFEPGNNRHVFEVYEGADRTHAATNESAIMPFAFEYGNLSRAVITDDKTDYRTYAYVAGEGEGVTRLVVETAISTDGELNLFELYVDARDLQSVSSDSQGNETILSTAEYREKLSARGLEMLNERVHVKSFNGEVNPADYGLDYKLGDEITCISTRHGININVRITQVDEVIENNVASVYLSFGTPEIISL